MTTSTIKSSSFQFISELIRKRSAIVLEPSKGYLVESRLSPIVRERNLGDLEMLVAELQKPGSQPLVQQVVEAMTTHETSFFRDIHPFKALQEVVLPEIIQKRSRERVINIWSNACSTGQEPFTIAMIIKEHFPELANWKVRLTATDISTKILDKAKHGMFSQTEINRGLPMNLLMKYFTREGIQWQIANSIRSMVDFQVVNLVDPIPQNFQNLDIVFLRNVLIYFCPTTKANILNRVHSTLNKDGFLFLGGAETTMNLNVPFEKMPVGSITCYRPV
jgi:chemotaxis protein methyltransferase CheR